MTIGPFSTATDLLKALRDRSVSAVELLDMYVTQIDRHDAAINAVVIRDVDGARIRAAEADARRQRGEDAPLLGLPMTIKDCIYVAGMPTTGGVVERANTISVEDAPSVASLRAAGAVIFGKTNVPPYAGDYQTSNPLFGRTNNPWDLDRTPSGSSGGAAAALASGMTPLELGGDLAGSIRQPASFCGVYGHKPSETAVPGTGHFPGGLRPNKVTGMGAIGPMARSADDLALALDVIAGPTVGEGAAWSIRFPRPRHERLRDYRVAFMPAADWLEVDTEITSAMGQLADGLQQAGATVGWAQPEWPGGLRQYYQTFLQILYAFTATEPAHERPAKAEQLRAAGSLDDLAYADGLLATAQDYIGWWSRREQYHEAYRSFFNDWDVLIAPNQPLTAFVHDERPVGTRTFEINGKTVSAEAMMVHPGLCNLSGQPGTAFPFTVSSEGLPIGFQAIGPYLEDYTPIHFASLVANEFGGFVVPPGYDATTLTT